MCLRCLLRLLPWQCFRLPAGLVTPRTNVGVEGGTEDALDWVDGSGSGIALVCGHGTRQQCILNLYIKHWQLPDRLYKSGVTVQWVFPDCSFRAVFDVVWGVGRVGVSCGCCAYALEREGWTGDNAGLSTVAMELKL